MLVKIIKVMPQASREYTDRQGQKQVFKSKGFILNAGDGTFYAEAVQETATALEELGIKEGDCAFVQLSYVAREYKDSQGISRYANEITLRQMLMI